MKVLFVLGHPNPFPGAGWTRIGFFADFLSKNGHSVEVLGTFSRSYFQKRGLKRYNYFNIFNLIFNIGRGFHPLLFILNSFMSFIFSFFFEIARKPHVTVISIPPGKVGIGASMACKLLGIKYIIDYRDEWEDYILGINTSKIYKGVYSIVKNFMTKIYTKGNLTVAVTPFFAKNLYLRGVKNVKVVPNGADANIFVPCNKKKARRKLGLCEDVFIIVYNGLIGAYYKLDVVIKALKKLKGSLRGKVKLMIVGDGPDLMKLLSAAKNLNLENNVCYLGVKDNKKELAEILSAADVGIIPGLYTQGQLPVKFYEYCACGLPVIATIDRDSLLAKFIIRYKIGVVCPPSNEEKLAETIYWLYAHKPFTNTAGKRARRFVEENFDRNKIAKTFLKLIESLGHN